MVHCYRYGEISELTVGQCIPQHNMRKRQHHRLKMDITNSLVLQFEGSTPSTQKSRHWMPSRASFIASTTKKKWSSRRNRPWEPRRGTEVQLYALTTALDGGGWLTPRPGCFTPRRETRYPSNSRLGEPQGQSGRVRKIPPATGIRSSGRPALSQSLYQLRYPSPIISTKYSLLKMYFNNLKF